VPQDKSLSIKGWPVDLRLLRPTFLAQGGLTHSSGIFLPILFWLLLGLRASCWSQTASTGALVGEVLDPMGRPIAHASVEAKDQDTALSRTTVSDSEAALPSRYFRPAPIR
jgi:hypothetical protein